MLRQASSRSHVGAADVRRRAGIEPGRRLAAARALAISVFAAPGGCRRPPHEQKSDDQGDRCGHEEQSGKHQFSAPLLPARKRHRSAKLAGAVAGLPVSQVAGRAAAGPRGLTSPGDAGLALAAQAVRMLGDRTAWAATAPVVGECGKKIRVHLKLLPLGAVVRCSGLAACASLRMQNAPGEQDAVTTQRDGEWTCRDVPTKVKPSYYVLRAWVECQTRGCERSCWSEG